jgi:hypothetical protein
LGKWVGERLEVLNELSARRDALLLARNTLDYHSPRFVKAIFDQINGDLSILCGRGHYRLRCEFRPQAGFMVYDRCDTHTRLEAIFDSPMLVCIYSLGKQQKSEITIPLRSDMQANISAQIDGHWTGGPESLSKFILVPLLDYLDDQK